MCEHKRGPFYVLVKIFGRSRDLKEKEGEETGFNIKTKNPKTLNKIKNIDK